MGPIHRVRYLQICPQLRNIQMIVPMCVTIQLNCEFLLHIVLKAPTMWRICRTSLESAFLPPWIMCCHLQACPTPMPDHTGPNTYGTPPLTSLHWESCLFILALCSSCSACSWLVLAEECRTLEAVTLGGYAKKATTWTKFEILLTYNTPGSSAEITQWGIGTHKHTHTLLKKACRNYSLPDNFIFCENKPNVFSILFFSA